LIILLRFGWKSDGGSSPLAAEENAAKILNYESYMEATLRPVPRLIRPSNPM